jgi:hypothetical protein
MAELILASEMVAADDVVFVYARRNCDCARILSHVIVNKERTVIFRAYVLLSFILWYICAICTLVVRPTFPCCSSASRGRSAALYLHHPHAAFTTFISDIILLLTLSIRAAK